MATPLLVDKNSSSLQKMTTKNWHSRHIDICQLDDVQNKRSLGTNLSQLNFNSVFLAKTRKWKEKGELPRLKNIIF